MHLTFGGKHNLALFVYSVLQGGSAFIAKISWKGGESGEEPGKLTSVACRGIGWQRGVGCVLIRDGETGPN